MRVQGACPTWATALVELVCKDYRRSVPSTFRWRNCNRLTSSGTTYSPRKGHYRYLLKNGNVRYYKNNGEIRIRAGTDIDDQKLVLLHELAHHITNKIKRCGHNRRFWDLAFELYEHYGLDLEKAFEREKDYRQTATIAYQAILAKK